MGASVFKGIEWQDETFMKGLSICSNHIIVTLFQELIGDYFKLPQTNSCLLHKGETLYKSESTKVTHEKASIFWNFNHLPVKNKNIIYIKCMFHYNKYCL